MAGMISTLYKLSALIKILFL